MPRDNRLDEAARKQKNSEQINDGAEGDTENAPQIHGADPAHTGMDDVNADVRSDLGRVARGG